MKPVKIVLLSGILLLWGSLLSAQPYVPDEQIVLDNAPTLLGITILGNPTLSFRSVEDYANGVSANHSTLSLAVSLGLSWSLQVRATDDLRSQGYTIPVSLIGIQSISLGNRPEIKLSTVNQLLASGLVSSLLNSLLATIRYSAPGGKEFLKPAGTYTTTLVFSQTAL